jgi:hypothetical protein
MSAVNSVMQFFNGGVKIRRLLLSIKDQMTALAGGGQTGAPMFDDIGVVQVCATNNNSILMPPWQRGRIAVVINQGADTLKIFSYESVAVTPYAQVTQFQPPLQSTGMTAGTTGITLATGKSMWFVGGLDPTGAYPCWNELSAPGN